MRGLLVVGALLLAGPRVEAQADEYVRAVRVALQELAAGDVQAGRDRLTGLVRQAPQRTAAHCHLGSAHRLAGDPDAALAAFQECARLAEHSQQLTHRARGLLGIAQVLAAQPARLAEAKEAYAALLTFAEANDGVIDPALVRSRLEAVEAILAADAAAAEVRQRREERARESAEAEAESAGSADSED